MIGKLDLESVDKLLLAGNATFTMVSKVSNKRLTLKIQKVKDKENFFFVKAKSGHNFAYLGAIGGGKFFLTKASKFSKDSEFFKAMDWLVNKMNLRNLPEAQVEIWHEGKCCRCGKTLTVPASIQMGIGPECVKKTF